MAEAFNISDKSKTIAKNTLLLYFRMFLLLFVGLFTARIILNCLGEIDYGTYNAVSGMVTLFTVVTGALSSAISRFITYEIGTGNKTELEKVFANSKSIMLLIGIILIVLIETLGVWFLNTKMEIPDERLFAANYTLHCSAFILLFNMLSIPFTASILAHEKMEAYAFISILEAALKLGIALAISHSGFDKLIIYSILMAVSALIIRIAYAVYCRRHFEETKARMSLNKTILKKIGTFAGWSSLPAGVFLINTQGLNLLTNLFFGVSANAARGIAVQVEGIVKQCVNNVIISINPQITKSYASGDKNFSYQLISKGAKYSYLIMLTFIAPSLSETQTILELWLVTVPAQAALFTKLTLICVALDLMMTPFSTIVLADGKIKKFYSVFFVISILIFPITWLLFRAGAEAYAAYLVFIIVYLILDVSKLILTHTITGYPYSTFFNEVLAKVAVPTVVSLLTCFAIKSLIPEATVFRMFVSVLSSTAIICICCYFFALTPGEKAFVNSKFHIRQQ